RIECVQCSKRSAVVLGAQLAHVTVPGGTDSTAVRIPQHWATFLEQADRGSHGFLFTFGKAFPPAAELVRVFDIPSCGQILASVEYSVNGIQQRNRRSRAGADLIEIPPCSPVFAPRGGGIDHMIARKDLRVSCTNG